VCNGGFASLEANYRGRFFGPELEIYVVDKNSLRPKNIIKEFEKCRLFEEKLIKPELASEQIELNSKPTFDLARLYEDLRKILKVAIEIAERNGCVLLPLAFYPNQNYSVYPNKRYYKILNFLGKPGRKYAPTVASDQINIGANDERDAFEIYNKFRTFLPILTGFSVASPFDENGMLGNKCERLTAYNKTLINYKELTGFPPEFKNLAEYFEEINKMPIFKHPNMYYKYARPMPHRGVAIEIRSIDKQPSLSEYISIVALCKGLLNAKIKNDNNDDLLLNFQKAVRDGIYNKSIFREVLEISKQNLNGDEKGFLLPLERRLEKGTIADKMKEEFLAGKKIKDIYLELIECLIEDRCYV
jgi:gamma-glutamyl:cysteine ligase YbdK (ATP-grasp superfamily)